MFEKTVAAVKKYFSRGPTTTTQKAGPVEFGAKGLSPGEEIGVGSDPLAIYRTNISKQIPKDKAMQAYTGWVFACVKAIADEMAAMRFRLYRTKSDGSQEEVMDHDLLDLLDSVNEFQTGPELKHMMASHLELTGNCYILLLGVKNEMSKPTGLYILNSANVKVILDKTIFPYTIRGFEYHVDNKKYSYKPYEIVHLKYPDPNDPYEGIGTVQTIPSWIDLDNYAVEFNRKFFLNGARIGGFLESEATGEAMINSLRLSFESNHGGVENAHKTAVLPKGVKYAPAQATAKDMDMSKMMDMTQDRILAGFRVSRTILGTAESDTNRATAETADYIFARRTIKPKMELICSYLNEFLTYRYGEDIYISFIDPTPEDKAFRIQEMQATMGSAPVLSANEAREKYLGAGPIENGDNVMSPSLMVPLGAPQQDQATPKKSIKNKDVRVIKTRFVKHAQLRKASAEILAQKVASEIARIKEIKTKQLSKMSDDEYAVIWKEFVERVDVYEKKTIAAIKEINTKQKAEVLKALPALYARETKAIKKADLFNLEDWIQSTTDLITPIMTELYGKESTAAAEAVGVTGIDLIKDPKTIAAIKRAMELMSESYNQTTLDSLTEKLNDIIASGATMDEAAQMVGDIYEFSDLSRAASVARTETFRVANDATKAGWKETGVVKTIKWYTAHDGDVCPFCLAQRNKEISIDDNFYDEGDTVHATDSTGNKVSMTADYGDVGAPPIHVNCRCYIAPAEVSLE